MTIRDEAITKMARAILVKRIGPFRPFSEAALHEMPLEQFDGFASARTEATAALDALIQHLQATELVYRDARGDVVHEIRGAPNDVWQAMIGKLEG